MSPLAHTLLCAIRYAHGRSLHPYEEVISAIRQVWSQIDPHSQRYFLFIVESQVPEELEVRIKNHRGGFLPVSQRELEKELQDYRNLFSWCRENLGALPE